jgi:Mn-dependent DtxR family transcriptional regulator
MSRPTTEFTLKLIEYLEANPKMFDTITVAKKFGVSRSTVSSIAGRFGVRYLLKKQERSVEALEKDFPSKLLLFLKKQKDILTLEKIADAMDVAPKHVREAMGELSKAGHNIKILSEGAALSREIEKAEPFFIDISKMKGKTFRFGVTGDNHLGSKYERLDVLNALFDIYEREGIKTVYQLGNMIEGEARFNKYELTATGIEGQTQYFIKHWPKKKDIVTHFITGDDHEGWYIQREGVDIGRYIEDRALAAGRKDLKYLGHMEHDVVFRGSKKNAVMRLIHAGGGSSYATSYTAQKIVESYQGGEKPNILLIGHYHKSEYGYPREVHCVQVGTTQDQSSFMRKKKLQAHVGGWIIEFTVTPEGDLTRFKTEWIPFFDKGFYDKAWKQKFV